MSAPLAPVSPNRLGFCQRCGDPISGKIRCSRCGGSSKEPGIRSTQALPAAKKPDPWAHRYVHGDSSFVSSTDQEEEYLHNQPPPLSPKRASYDPALGFGMPSRISRDLRTGSVAKVSGGELLDPSQLSPAPAQADPRRASQDYTAPVVKGSDGVLSKVCGSLVEPSTSRNRWACSDCATIFARDSTLYAPPSSAVQNDVYYCRDCYARRYSMGDCRGCGRDVLGSTKEDGKYVKASSGIWHGRCWKCGNCQKAAKDGVEVMIGMDGNPTCEGCFDRPRRATLTQPARDTKVDSGGLPDVRRLTRVAASRNGPMGATIAELTKKLGQTSVSTVPRMPFSSTRASSTASLPKSSSSQGSLDTLPQSPTKSQYAFPNHVPSSPGKTSMTRSGSLTGSPPKPRPLTAQFRDGMNLAAFQPSFGNKDEDERVQRRDSRSRSVSPVKRPEWQAALSPPKQLPVRGGGNSGTSFEKDTLTTQSEVPGSSSSAAIRSAGARGDVAAEDAGRSRTTSGFPRPLNAPSRSSSKSEEPSRPVPSGKSALGLDTNPRQIGPASPLEPDEGTTRCAACHLLPFEPFKSTGAQEVVMVTLADNVHLHAECFRCAICHEMIDGTKPFVRMDGAAGSGNAHPQCSPTVQLKIVQTSTERPAADRSFRNSLDPASARDGGKRSHATHQGELKPSPVPSPSASVRTKEADARPTILPLDSSRGSSATTPIAIRRFQPTTGAAAPINSAVASCTAASTASKANLPITVKAVANPAAGIFSRLNALETASGNTLLTQPSSHGRYGGMQNCAFCGTKLSSLESVLGPRGTAWHKTCLICRAPPPTTADKDRIGWSRKPVPTMCGKQLDSGAKVNQDGEVRCRDCYDKECSSFRIKT